MSFLELLRDAGRALWSFRQSRKGFAVLWILVILFLGRAALDSYAEYESLSLSIKWTAVGISLLFLVAYNLSTPLKWMYMLNVSGARISYLQTSRAFFISQLSSFIPGGVWQYLDLGYRVSEKGKSLGSVAHTALYVHGVNVAAAFFYAAIMAAIYLPGYTLISAGIGTIILVGVAFSADIFEVFKAFLKRMDVDVGDYRPSKTRLLVLFVASLVIWPLSGAALFFLVASLMPVTAQMFIPISGIMAASWAAGFMVLVLPGGLGVREAVMVGALSQFIPVPVALAVTVLSRVTTLSVKVSVSVMFGIILDDGS